LIVDEVEEGEETRVGGLVDGLGPFGRAGCGLVAVAQQTRVQLLDLLSECEYVGEGVENVLDESGQDLL
jgi:hypothetical protein